MRNRQQGFSLVEVMVASALLMGGILMATNYITAGQGARKTRTLQSIHRFLAIQTTQVVTSGIHLYPPIEAPNSSEGVYYVACFDNKGGMVPHKSGAREYQFTVTKKYDDKAPVPSESCEKTTANYEVHFYWLNPTKNEVAINILNLRPGQGPDRLNFQSFKIFAK